MRFDRLVNRLPARLRDSLPEAVRITYSWVGRMVFGYSGESTVLVDQGTSFAIKVCAGWLSGMTRFYAMPPMHISVADSLGHIWREELPFRVRQALLQASRLDIDKSIPPGPCTHRTPSGVSVFEGLDGGIYAYRQSADRMERNV